MGFKKDILRPSITDVGKIGKGLLSDVSQSGRTAKCDDTINIKMDYLYDNKHNKYSQEDIESLAESIRMIGLQQPLVAIRIDDEHYDVTTGHRRLKALKMLRNDGRWGEYVPVVLKDLSQIELELDDDKKERLMIIETNKERRANSDLDTLMEIKEYTEIIDELRAKGYKEVYGKKISGVKTRELVSESFGMSEQMARRYMSVAKNASDSVMNTIAEGDLSVSAASEIVTEPEEIQEKIVQKVKEIKEETGQPITPSSFKTAKEVVKNAENFNMNILKWNEDTDEIQKVLNADKKVALNASEKKIYDNAIKTLKRILCK